MLPLYYFLGLSAAMFAGGLFGVLTQKNAVRILVSVEIMLNSANIAVASFNGVFGYTMVEGWTFVLVIIAIAAAEAAIGMAIFLAVFRNHKEIVISDIFALGETEEAF